ncbi:MAG: Ig-like domain repeat protein [Nocardioides sp.]|uniref:Ig-like domain repeat protein n=1 Tax=Nocardioides sp. TaxID=35761 RepID=UPI003F0900B2
MSRMHWRWGASTVATLAVVASTLGAVVPAQAAPGAPSGLSSNPGQRAPSLSWDHVMGASDYQVQMDDTSDFSSPIVLNTTSTPGVTTKNNTYVPTVQLPLGQVHWRVRAGVGSTWSDWSYSSIDTGAAVAGPVLSNPGPGVTFQVPRAPHLSWEPVPGTAQYRVELSRSSSFVDATAFTTATTSYALTSPPAYGEWWWRVRSVKAGGVESQWSGTGSFTVTELPLPTLTFPPDNASYELQDVVLDWEPLAGARSYDVQISVNSDFTAGSIVKDEVRILSSRYSPGITIPNAQYHWRVRGRDMDDQPMSWSAARSSFNRTWPQRPEPVYPIAAGVEDVPGPVFFQWKPVPHASEYEVQLGNDANFSPGTFNACRVAGTTYTPGMFAVNSQTGQHNLNRIHEKCRVASGQTMYWRVRAIDRPADASGIEGIFSETHAFRFDPNAVTDMSPNADEPITDGVPTLSWSPVQGATEYRIQIRNRTGDLVDSASTQSTTYTPGGSTPLSPADGPFSWSLRAITQDNQTSPIFTKTFTISGAPTLTEGQALDPVFPLADTPGLQEAPAFRWQPHPTASYYVVDVGKKPEPGAAMIWFASMTDSLIGRPVPYPTMTDTSSLLLTPGDYVWRVTPYNADGTPLTAGPLSQFTIQPIATVVGHSVALDGMATDAGDLDGPGNPCTGSTGRCEPSSSPVISWDPDPRAAFYMVYVSADASFTNLFESATTIPATTSSIFYPTLSHAKATYPDTDAGEALHWYIRACKDETTCGPSPVSVANASQHSFVKRSPAISNPVTTAAGDGEVTFSWDDYLATNKSPANTWAQTGENPTQSAKQYRVQVADNDTFSGPLTNVLVDQATFTSLSRMYPQDRTLYWRVQAVDYQNHGLPWSATQSFSATSAPVEQNSLGAPNAASPVTASTAPVFSWDAVPFNGSYDLEVYYDDSGAYSLSNRVFAKSGIKTTAYVHTNPLAPSANEKTYTWRVRARNASGEVGPWSSSSAPEARFKVSVGKLVAIAPTGSAVTTSTGPVLTWDAAEVPQATSFRVTVTPVTGSGATLTATTVATSYAVPSAPASGTYNWRITALDSAGGTLTEVSDTYTVDAALTAVEAPEIRSPEGSAVGNTIEVKDPTWNQPYVANTYQWLRAGSVISGATSSTYTLTQLDYGKPITVRVTGKRAGYTDGTTLSPALTPSAGSGLFPTVDPVISGTPVVGQYLSVSSGQWSRTSVTLTRQWLRDGAVITGATGSSYRLVAADAFAQVSVRVTASSTGELPFTFETSPVLVEHLVADAAPVVEAPDGLYVGATLQAVAPVWSQPGVSTTYQWLRGTTSISGASGPSYTPTAADIGKAISVRATGTLTGFQTATAVSESVTIAAGNAPQNTVAPSITGTLAVNQLLTVDTGEWTPTPRSFTYRWMRNGVTVDNQTRSTYRLTAADAGTQVSVEVTAKLTGYSDGVATSAAVAVPKVKSTTTATLPLKTVKPKAGKITFKVSATGVSAPTGTVKIFDGTKVIKTVTLKATSRGTMTVKLPKLKKGIHKLKVQYLGNTNVAGSKSKVVRLKVV